MLKPKTVAPFAALLVSCAAHPSEPKASAPLIDMSSSVVADEDANNEQRAPQQNTVEEGQQALPADGIPEKIRSELLSSLGVERFGMQPDNASVVVCENLDATGRSLDDLFEDTFRAIEESPIMKKGELAGSKEISGKAKVCISTADIEEDDGHVSGVVTCVRTDLSELLEAIR